MSPICQTLLQNLLSAYKALVITQGNLLDVRWQMIGILDHTSTQYLQLQQQSISLQNEITGWQGTISGLNQQMADSGCNAPVAGQ